MVSRLLFSNGYLQYPFVLGYCFTIYKSQGHKFGRVIVNVDDCTIVPGSFLTACSRVSKASDLLFHVGRQGEDILYNRLFANDRQVNDYKHFKTIKDN